MKAPKITSKGKKLNKKNKKFNSKPIFNKKPVTGKINAPMHKFNTYFMLKNSLLLSSGI